MFFGGFPGTSGSASSGGNVSNHQAQQRRMAMAQMEQELAMTDFLFQKIVDECQTKCINVKCHNEPDLTKGEAVCADRCVNKFFMTMDRMSTFLTKHAEKMMESNTNAAGGNPGLLPSSDQLSGVPVSSTQ